MIFIVFNKFNMLMNFGDIKYNVDLICNFLLICFILFDSIYYIKFSMCYIFK